MSDNNQQQRVEQYILFFTRGCGYCEKFIKILQDYPDLNVLFKKLAIEDLPRIPPQLREVPAIVVNDTNLLQSQQAFDWLKEKVKDSFGAGPEINPKGGFQDLGFSYLDNSSDNSLNSSTFSSITSPNTITDQQPQASVSQKNSLDNDYERFQRERERDTPKRGPPPQQPNFSLPY